MILTNADEDVRNQLGAARVQHEIAWRMRSKIAGTEHRTIEKYARSIGADPTRLGRMLRGTVIMRVEDMISAQRNLGVSLWPPQLDAALNPPRTGHENESSPNRDETNRRA